MPSYVPEYRYGLIPDSYRDPSGPHYGLVPWPAHMMPREQHARVGQVVQPPMADATISLSEDGVFFLTLNSQDRLSIATTVERLIGMLDALDGDPDIEANGDERDQSYPHGGQKTDQPYEDAEDGEDWEADFADDEPELGAPENHPTKPSKGRPAYGKDARVLEADQSHWSQGIDGEASLGWGEHGPLAANAETGDDREHDMSDDEPWLGALERHVDGDQTAWGASSKDDREDVSEDEGAQCDDEGSCTGYEPFPVMGVVAVVGPAFPC